MTQDEIRRYLGAHSAVHVQIAGPGDGSPELAWGDTFFAVKDKRGEPKRMPFATIVTKDYDGFDADSRLNRGGLHRLNIELGKGKFEALFGFLPNAFEQKRGAFDFAAIGQLFPHPAYGAHGWVSIINPAALQRELITELLDLALQRALNRAG